MLFLTCDTSLDYLNSSCIRKFILRNKYLSFFNLILWSLVNDQLDAQFFSMYELFQFSTCFEQPRAHRQEIQL